jgi:hypothetical protein
VLNIWHLKLEVAYAYTWSSRRPHVPSPKPPWMTSIFSEMSAPRGRYSNISKIDE